MHRFVRLVETLETAPDADRQARALQGYFAAASAEDAAWALYLLQGGKLGPAVPARRLAELAQRAAGVEPWLFEASHQAVGELAETIALILPPPAQPAAAAGLASWITACLLPLRGMPQVAQDAGIVAAWDVLDTDGRWLFTRLVGKGLRVEPGTRLLGRVLAAQAGLDERRMAQRLTAWMEAGAKPQAAHWQALMAPDTQGPLGWPLPFAETAPLAAAPEALGEVKDWLVQWLHDGVPVQAVKQQGQVWIWSADADLITEAVPEVAAAVLAWPDGTVLEGVLLAGPPGQPAPPALARLQRLRKGRKPTCKMMAEAPLTLLAHDLLQQAGCDLRGLSLQDRQGRLRAAAAMSPATALQVAPALQAESWAACRALHQAARQQAALGLMLRRRAVRGDAADPLDATTWQWRNQARQVLAVLSYVQAAGSAAAGPETRCSFALWNRAPADAAEVQAAREAIAGRAPQPASALQLVTIAQLCPELDVHQARELARRVQSDTLFRAGPVRVLRPSMVFELAFDDAQASPRRRSGVLLSGVRVLGWRPAVDVGAAGHLAQLHAAPSEPQVGSR